MSENTSITFQRKVVNGSGDALLESVQLSDAVSLYMSMPWSTSLKPGNKYELRASARYGFSEVLDSITRLGLYSLVSIETGTHQNPYRICYVWVVKQAGE